MKTRVFVGYGYNPRDQWVETYVIPLVKAFDCEVLHGKEVYGGALPDEVLQLIKTSHAMIGLTTRRDPAAGTTDKYTTHPWVVHEILAALAHSPTIPFVEIREEGVIDPGGMLNAYQAQRIEYREADRAACLVRIAQALRRFIDQTRLTTVRLGPEPVVEELDALIDNPTFSCRSQIWRGANRLPEEAVPVLPKQGGLFVMLRGILEGDLVRLTLQGGGRVWRSSYESVDSVDIELRSRE